MVDINKLTFYYVDNFYIEHLIKEIDDRVSYNKADSHQRPYVGFILEINEIPYLVPLSSKLRKTNEITTLIPNTFTEAQKQEEDFQTKYPKFIATIKFNCMIPICGSLIKKIDLSELISNEEDINYRNLLTKEIKYCNENKDNIIKKASKTYQMCENNKPYKADLIKSCCNFSKLEQAMINYLNTLN